MSTGRLRTAATTSNRAAIFKPNVLQKISSDFEEYTMNQQKAMLMQQQSQRRVNQP